MNELLTNNTMIVDEYKPTTAEERMLEVLLNPESTGKNTTEKCQLADVSRETWYKAFKKPGFVKLVNETSVDLIREKVSDVLNATYKSAMTEGAKGFQDRKILLEMAGVYREKSDINLNAQDPLKAQVMAMTDVEILQKIKEFAKDHPEVMGDLIKNEE